MTKDHAPSYPFLKPPQGDLDRLLARHQEPNAMNAMTADQYDELRVEQVTKILGAIGAEVHLVSIADEPICEMDGEIYALSDLERLAALFAAGTLLMLPDGSVFERRTAAP
jgi:hypothetical protein